MAKQINVNFHQTFKPEGQYISSILNVADGMSWLSIKEISGLTGIPQGKSSGKVEPHILYANYMGLIEYKKRGGLVELTRTELGKVVYMEDLGLQETLTKLLLHAMILREDSGADIWSTTFKKIFPKYRDGIKKGLLILELNQIYVNKVNTKNMAPFFGAYEDLFADLGIVSWKDDMVVCNTLRYNKEFVYLYALVLWKYWDEYYPFQEEISSIQLTTLNFGKAFGWDSQYEYEVLEHLVDKGLLRMNRQLMPYTILKLVSSQELIDRLYSELC